MTIYERHTWACDRRFLCETAVEICDVEEVGFWVWAVLYLDAVIDYLEELF